MESGAAVFAATYSDMQTAADKCEEMEEGYAQCSKFLYGRMSHLHWIKYHHVFIASALNKLHGHSLRLLYLKYESLSAED